MSHFIIGGTEKAGTTSVFEYLAMHPQVCASRRKETDYFRQPDCSSHGYRKQFPAGERGQVWVEASPGYLGLAQDVAPRIRDTLDQCTLLFILRDPVERFQSSYRFHRSKFYIPESLSIDDYTDLCLAFDRGDISLADTPFGNRWFLDVLPAGRYACHLQHYLALFGERVLLQDFDHLNRNPATAMERICAALDIDPGFYHDFEFFRANATFQGRVKALHLMGMKANRALEPVLRRYPRLKRRAVSLYRGLNGAAPPAGTSLSPASAARLRDYYAEDVARVGDLLRRDHQQTIQWKYFHAL